MEYPSAPWLQATPIPDLQPIHDERPSATSDDWKEQDASMHTVGGDLLGDIQVGSSNAASSPGPTFFTLSNLPHIFLTPNSPFNTVSYSSSQWSSPSTQLPLSNYSSLNGATSTLSHSQPQSQASATLAIDPGLMNAPSTSPPPQQYQPSSFLSQQQRMQYSYPQQPQSHSSALSINQSYVHPNPSHFQQPQPQISSIPLPRTHSHSPPQPQSQGTLSPFVLHSPSSTYFPNGIPPASFYGQPPPAQPQAGPSTPQPPQPVHLTSQVQPASSPAGPPKVSAEQQKAQLNRDVKPLIQPTSFTGAGAVSQLVNLLDDFGIAEVDAATRLEILTRIRDNAGNHYFRAWVDNPIAMDVVREWLKLAFVGRSDWQMVETIMPILQIIDRLPLTIDKLKLSKLGKLIMRLMKDPPTPAIKDMASNLERKWRTMVAKETSANMDTDNTEDAKGKKRRAEGATAKGAPPAKKVAVSGVSTTTTTTTTFKAAPVKKEAKPVVKDAKSDSSFFSKPKPTKKDMPSFKKNPPTPVAAPVKKEPDPNVAQPSSFNPFEEVLKSLKSTSGSGSSASTSTPPPVSVAGPSSVGPLTTVPSGLNKSGKPKKTVTWAPDGRLEQIKLIERAVYDDDPATGSHPAHNIRDLDRDEGAALHAHLFDEQIEWTEPQPLKVPPEIQIPPRGGESQERAAQEEREQSALIVLYTSPTQIPDSPAEPQGPQLPEEQVDDGVCIMLTGSEVDAIFWSGGMPALADISPSVTDLIGQLRTAAPDVTMTDAARVAASVYPNFSFSGLSPDQLQLLMQQAQALTQGGTFNGLGPTGAPLAPTQPAHGDSAAGWGPGNQYGEYDRGYHENGAGDPGRRWSEDGWPSERGSGARGRGARGGVPLRGRGRGDGFRSTKRKPCSFFQAGRCRYGDQCDFSHEQLPY